jgi:predicted amidohydrolase YtcJ
MSRSYTAPQVEILLRGGRVHPLGGHAAVEALLIRGGRIAALGAYTEVREMRCLLTMVAGEIVHRDGV